jgi:hypothetical protein
VGGGVLDILAQLLFTGLGVLTVLFIVFLIRRDFRRFRAKLAAERLARARAAPRPVAPPPRITAAQPRPAPQGRCPFCHEDVGALACVVCAHCLARHHDDCWTEGGACAACRGTERYGKIDETRDRVQG